MFISNCSSSRSSRQCSRQIWRRYGVHSHARRWRRFFVEIIGSFFGSCWWLRFQSWWWQYYLVGKLKTTSVEVDDSKEEKKRKALCFHFFVVIFACCFALLCPVRLALFAHRWSPQMAAAVVSSSTSLAFAFLLFSLLLLGCGSSSSINTINKTEESNTPSNSTSISDLETVLELEPIQHNGQ